MTLLRALLCLLTRFVFSLRYRVRVEGLERLGKLKSALILPNHPAYMDPPIVLGALWPRFHPRPTVLRGVMSGPLLGWLPKVLGALEIPDVEFRSSGARDKVDEILDDVIEGLKKGQNQILWPSGRVQRDGVERLGSARGVHRILEAVPNCDVVLVRTRGLYGSRFSYARTGHAPPLTKGLMRGMGLLLGSLIFFLPRRRVNLRVERVERSKLDGLDRDALSLALEEYYNEEGPETPSFVPSHHIFGAKSYAFPPPPRAPVINAKRIREDIKVTVFELLSSKLESTDEKLKQPNTRLVEINLDSLDTMDLSLELEKRFNVKMNKNPTTVGELWALAQGLGGSPEIKPPTPEWLGEKRSSDLLEIYGETLHEALLLQGRRHRKDFVVADDLSGPLNYERFMVGSLLMASRFRDIQGDHIGILLPASVATDMVFFAIHFAGKTPVMINFTTGPAHMHHGLDLMKVNHVITSKAFLERSDVELEGVDWVYLEELRAGFRKWEAIWTLMKVRLGFGLSKLTRHAKKTDPAVVLFTSGSERAPKAVPLTHENVLCNIRGLVSVYDLSRRDIVFGFLPPFHSFGLSVTTMVPLLGGGRLIHHPDPTDAGALAAKVAIYGVTVLPGTPTLVSSMVERAGEGDLSSLRLVFVGAEKCPESLFNRLHKDAPNASCLEGYGITECAPMISANRPKEQKRGSVGIPLPNVTPMIVNPETLEPAESSERGLLLVSGPNVFPGYFGDEVPDPFVMRDGKRWYNTGDLVRIDEEGYIFFEGRMKRFLKAGGEMVSLPAIEEPFSKRFASDEDGPLVAVEGIENEGRPRIVLFVRKNVDVDISEARKILSEDGLRGVFKVDEVRVIDAIPLLGTGKTDYKSLRALIERELS